MPRRRRYDPDPEVNAWVHSWHRAQATALTAVGLLIAWGICALLASTQEVQPAFAAIPRLFATVFKLGAIIFGIAAIGRCAYAYFYPPWRDR